MRRLPKVGEKVPSDLDTALATMSAEALREVVHEVLLELDDRAHARVVASLIARAARTGAGWAPAPVTGEQVAEVLAFVKAAERVGQADPSEVDEYLRRGSAAFLRKDYASAHRIFGALLPPIGEGNIDLGQHELVDEVLGADVAECAAQHVVSAYMLAPTAERAEAVRAAIDRVQGVGHFWELAAMKKAAESRVAGVTEQKRRRHYGHAAELVATCVACDKTEETKRWAAALQAEYQRFPALRDELERASGAR